MRASSYLGSLQVSKILLHSSALKRWATWRLLPLRRSIPLPAALNSRRQRLRVRRQIQVTLQARTRPAPAALASVISSITFCRQAALVSFPRPPSSRPPTFFAAPARPPSPPGPSPCVAVPSLVFLFPAGPGRGAFQAPFAPPLLALRLHQVPPARWPRPGRRCLAPAVYLFKEQTPLSAVATELSGIEPSCFKHHREFIGSTPAIWVFL